MERLSNNAIRKRLKHLGETIECGLHSGFPPCCIQFYVTVWLWVPKTRKSKFFREYWEKMDRNHKHGKTRSSYDKETYIGYIPCPSCLNKKNFIKVKRCPKGSACWHRAELSK